MIEIAAGVEITNLAPPAKIVECLGDAHHSNHKLFNNVLEST